MIKLQNLNLKFLIQAHTKLGLFALFFFYISAFFGTITLFMPQIHTWENTSRYFQKEQTYNYHLDNIVQNTIKQQDLSTKKIEIVLPSYKDDVIAINDKYSKTIYINPYTQTKLDTKDEKYSLSEFLNEVHIGRNIPKFGQILMGIASILTLFLLISGLILFLNKHKTKKTFNFTWHKNISLALTPYILVFALTSSMLGFMLSSSAPLAYSATKGETTNMRAIVRPILFQNDKIPAKSNDTKQVTMLELDSLLNIAQDNYKNLKIQKITLLQWNDKNAQIKFQGYLTDNRILSGSVNRQFIKLSGVDGKVIDKSNLQTLHTGNLILSAFYYFHFIPDETLIFRIVYAIFGIGFLLSLIFGFLLWSNKTSSKYKNNPFYFNFVDRLSISVMLGVIPAIAFTIIIYWLIPKDTFERLVWIEGSFYLFWAFTLFLSTYIKNVTKLLKTLFLLSAILLYLIVPVHLMQTIKYTRGLFDITNIHTIYYVDLVFILLGIVFYICYKNFDKYFSRLNNKNIKAKQ